LIDAWPCGWTKTLVDVERIPKPAYYAMKEGLIPARVSLRRDRFTVYSGEKVVADVYAFNDLADSVEACVEVAVYFDGELRENYEREVNAAGCASTYCGEVNVKIPDGYVGTVRLVARMKAGERVTFDEAEYIVKPKLIKAKTKPKTYGKQTDFIRKLCEKRVNEKVIFASQEEYETNREEIEKAVTEGKKAVVFINRPLRVFGEEIAFRIHTLEEEVRANNYVAFNPQSRYVQGFSEMDFMNFYNREKDYQDLTAWFKFDWAGAEEILYTFEDCNGEKYDLHKKHKLIAAEKECGKGSLILTTLSALDGCVGYNPALDKFLINLIEK